MRLIHAESRRFVEFLDEDEIPDYAILSHTWSDEEATYDEVLNLVNGISDMAFDSVPRYQKLSHATRQARCDGLDYVWIDTCCIDKRSSAELSEALNSMYRWYQMSKRCYVFLSDVEATAGDVQVEHDLLEQFKGSRWFTRGWTLQELIAPRRVEFFNRKWENIGRAETLKGIISERTGIPAGMLDRTRLLPEFSILARMSWAANRETTRLEDVAYCLLGIFNVNMPLLYGERQKAFHRLQEEIIKSSGDYSAFGWGRALANSPAELVSLQNMAASWRPPMLSTRGIQLSPPSFHGQDLKLDIRPIKAEETWEASGVTQSRTSSWVCDECSKCFEKSKFLEQHAKETKHLAYKCEASGCGKRFSIRTAFVRHNTNLHHETKPHDCSIWEKRSEEQSEHLHPEYRPRDCRCSRACAPVTDKLMWLRSGSECQPRFDAIFEPARRIYPLPQAELGNLSSRLWSYPQSAHLEASGNNRNMWTDTDITQSRESDLNGCAALSDCSSSSSSSASTPEFHEVYPNMNVDVLDTFDIRMFDNLEFDEEFQFEPMQSALPDCRERFLGSQWFDEPETYHLPIPKQAIPAKSRSISSDTPARYSCHLSCGKSFKRSYELRRHMNDIHRGGTSFTCSLCGYKVKRRDKILDHCRKKHGQIRGKETFNDGNILETTDIGSGLDYMPGLDLFDWNSATSSPAETNIL